jgi:hypothetical protein
VRPASGRNRASRERTIAEVRAIKLARGCADCGYRGHWIALDFDHRPGEQKLGGVSRITKDDCRQKALDEIAKCDVVCANCHRVRSHLRGHFARGRTGKKL